MLFTQIAQTHALPGDKGLWALKASVEALVRDRVSMRAIDLRGAELSEAKLSGPFLRRANLNNTALFNAVLHDADLPGHSSTAQTSVWRI